MITTRPGILRVKQDTELAGQRLNKGDKIYLLTYLGEGYSKIWFAGTIFSGDPYEADTYETIQEASAVWWVKIKNRAGKVGWSRQPEHFGNMDQCG